MADLLHISSKYAYIRVRVPSEWFGRLSDSCGGQARALRMIRELFGVTISRIDPSSSCPSSMSPADSVRGSEW